MTSKFFALTIAFIIVLAFSTSAQIREIPKDVQLTFANQYPRAENIDYKDQLVKVNVHFTLDSAKWIASYSNKGVWKETEREWDYERLSEAIKDGFAKSKYADDEWEIKETAIVYLPGGGEQYRIKIEKNELQKKYLFFNKRGRLLRDAITI